MSVFQFSPGVGVQNGATIPATQYATSGGGAVPSTADDASVDTVNGNFLGEPIAVWLGFIILLILLKVLSQTPGVKVLGENVNPAYIRIGGYNVLAITVSAAVGFIALKLLANSRIGKALPGFPSFVNAI